ncbi:MAG: ACT domain-containing protein [Caulobacteraceae bacterium]
MNDAFILHIDFAEGSLQRLIGVIERRGFDIDRMTLTENGAHREVRLCVRARDAGRCMEVLGRQLDRLIGVRRISATSFAQVEEASRCTA